MEYEVKQQIEKIHWKKRCLKGADSQNESTPSSSSSITPPTSPTSTTPTSPTPASPLATSQTPPSPLPRSFHEFTHHPGGPFAYPPPTSNGLKRRSSSPLYINHPPKRPTVVLHHPALHHYPTLPQLIPNSQHFSSQPCFPNFFNPHNNPFLFPSLHFNSLACGLPPHHSTTLLPPLPPQPLPPPPPQSYHHPEDVKLNRILIPNLPDLTIERTSSRASSPRPSTSSYSSMNSPRSLISPASHYQQNEDGTSPSPARTRKRRRQDTLIPDDCPLSRNQIVDLPIDEFNELIERQDFTEAFKAQCRDWRRKGKNRVAARKSREKRIEGIDALRKRKRILEEQKKRMEDEIAKVRVYNANLQKAVEKLLKLRRPLVPTSTAN